MSNKKKKSERRDKKEDKKTSKEVPTAYLAPDDFEHIYNQEGRTSKNLRELTLDSSDNENSSKHFSSRRDKNKRSKGRHSSEDDEEPSTSRKNRSKKQEEEEGVTKAMAPEDYEHIYSSKKTQNSNKNPEVKEDRMRRYVSEHQETRGGYSQVVDEEPRQQNERTVRLDLSSRNSFRDEYSNRRDDRDNRRDKRSRRDDRRRNDDQHRQSSRFPGRTIIVRVHGQEAVYTPSRIEIIPPSVQDEFKSVCRRAEKTIRVNEEIVEKIKSNNRS